MPQFVFFQSKRYTGRRIVHNFAIYPIYIIDLLINKRVQFFAKLFDIHIRCINSHLGGHIVRFARYQNLKVKHILPDTFKNNIIIHAYYPPNDKLSIKYKKLHTGNIANSGNTSLSPYRSNSPCRLPLGAYSTDRRII